MSTYFDTSAIVKLYVNETFSDFCRSCLDAATLIATSRVAYPETRAAFARIQREGKVSEQALERMVEDFVSDWHHYAIKDVDEEVSRLAGRLAHRHALRGFDAIHLSTARFFHDCFEEELGFLAFDQGLNEAAKTSGMDVLLEKYS